MSRDQICFLLSGLLLAACSSDPAPTSNDEVLGLNDVSILMPLPKNQAEADLLLKLSTEGRGGPLFPRTMFDAIDLVGIHTARVGYDNFRIVGARIDPCFPDLSLMTTAPEQCRRQVRLVAQPIIQIIKPDVNIFGAEDDSLHLFYEFSQADFDQLVEQWLSLRTEASSDPNRQLMEHPRLSAEGMDGEMARDFAGMLMQYVGTESLVQFTASEGVASSWHFLGYQVSDQTLTPMVIPKILALSPSQTITTDETGGFSATPESDPLITLRALSDTSTQSQTQITDALTLSLQIDNPTQAFHPENLDCASCHLATRARLRADSLGFATDGLPKFQNFRNLTIASSAQDAASPSEIRAFGFHQERLIVNQRVVNESAAVADALAIYLQ